MEHKHESLNTKEFAELVRVESQTIRRGYCVDGHYMGIKPVKLPNHRLLWPKDEALRVLGAEAGRC
jgi:hypothetical protein